MKANNNKHDITIHDKTNNKIYLLKIKINILDNLQAYKYENLHKYII